MAKEKRNHSKNKIYSPDDILNTEEFKLVCSDVDKFVAEKLNGYEPSMLCGKKVIHDPIWGSVTYDPWEIQLIDSPLFQRLRDISQTGLALLTYPSARHSRFEHSLGVAAAAKLMCDKLERNSKNNCAHFTMIEEDRNEVIFAALVHDIGHCFFSHLSERIYDNLCFYKPDKDGNMTMGLFSLKNKINEYLLLKPKSHELLSFVIINTPSFKNFFEKTGYPRPSDGRNIFLEAGCMIIGADVRRNNEIYSYLTSIINGPFDADKLDYIKRDSVTAGLALQYDMERLFTKMCVIPAHATDSAIIDYKLVIELNGVTAIEELTFCKIMLFSYIYYHHKVLVSEAMITDYVYGLIKLDFLNSCCDFLKYTDAEILMLANQVKEEVSPFPDYHKINLKALSRNIKNRKLPKRCFEMSQNNIIVTGGGQYTMDDFVKPYLEMPYDVSLCARKKFYDMLVKKYIEKKKDVDFDMFDIYIIFPKSAFYGNGDDKVVLGRDRKQLIKINDFIKLDPWAEAFKSNKWRGYIFVSEIVDRKLAYETACEFVFNGNGKLSDPSLYIKGIL